MFILKDSQIPGFENSSFGLWGFQEPQIWNQYVVGDPFIRPGPSRLFVLFSSHQASQAKPSEA